MSENKLIVLKSLNKEWASSRSLIQNNIELHDRNATSLLLNLMKTDGLIKKSSNGYWRIMPEGKAYLEQNESDSSSTVEIDLSDDGKEEVGGSMSDPEPDSERAEPVVIEEQNINSDVWSTISQVMQQVPENTSLVIENDSAYIVFAKSQFKLKQPGDIEAVLRAASLYTGEL